ncbi:MAG TPA: DUF6587 family protein [Steroidobacteraceae bacterium]|jgi:hypothetical protein
MSGILDKLLVGLVLLLSLGYAVASMGPRSLRTRILGSLSRVAGSAPAFLRLKKAAQRLGQASTAKAAGACGGCDDCAPSAPKAGASAGEINVPVGKIGRRAQSQP